jgi:hypothetical protein
MVNLGKNTGIEIKGSDYQKYENKMEEFVFFLENISTCTMNTRV